MGQKISLALASFLCFWLSDQGNNEEEIILKK
jgi:hypothetical protein